MRTLVALGILLVAASAARAQQQENKLMDRLLRPNLTLTNSAQGKKFETAPAGHFDKSVKTRTFPERRNPVEKTFSEQRTLTPQQFAARHFRAGDTAANIATRNELRKNDTIIATPAASAGTQIARESNEAAPVREYADNRLFLGKGKSQRALSAQDKPLTIEQVRELLNKSK